MISIEKLSLFNIQEFRKLYSANNNSYICNQNFLDIYDNESFICKYYLRKQIRLFKVKNKFVGYIWSEYSNEDDITNIYGLYIENQYIDHINYDILKSLENNSLKIDLIDSSNIRNIVDKLEFTAISETVLMKISSKNYNLNMKNDNYEIRNFIIGEDENIRCEMQNSVFYSKNRIPLTVGDVLAEEIQDYYIKDFCIFICDKRKKEIGYGQIIYTNNKYTIVNFGIIEEYRRIGYGKILIKYLIQLANKNNIEEIHIKVDKNNFNAINLYKNIGFVEYNSLTTWSKY